MTNKPRHISEVSISVFQEINRYHHLDIQKQSYAACSLQDSYSLNLKDFSTKSRLMASPPHFDKGTRLSGMFTIFALKEFRFACLDNENLINSLYFQDTDVHVFTAFSV